jgi:glycosyltransferase involved in cell wall biosynthesis
LGCETICIPPTIDTVAYGGPENVETKRPIKVSYAGAPGKKDLFDNYLEALLRLDPCGERFLLNVAGLSEAEILKYPAMTQRGMTKLPRAVCAFGQVSHADALRMVGDSDFSVLQRYPKRYAEAGFPTKVVESMTMGTPVICNLTSDLGLYVKDGISGIVCSNDHVDSLIDALRRVETLTQPELLSLRHTARQVAEASFDYRIYVSRLENFMQRIRF